MTDNLPMFDAHQLRCWRERMGLNQRRASEVLGCSRAALNKWENNHSSIPPYIALACAAVALGLLPHGVQRLKPQPAPEAA